MKIKQFVSILMILAGLLACGEDIESGEENTRSSDSTLVAGCIDDCVAIGGETAECRTSCETLSDLADDSGSDSNVVYCDECSGTACMNCVDKTETGCLGQGDRCDTEREYCSDKYGCSNDRVCCLPGKLCSSARSGGCCSGAFDDANDVCF